jgi:hypothetical protein
MQKGVSNFKACWVEGVLATGHEFDSAGRRASDRHGILRGGCSASNRTSVAVRMIVRRRLRVHHDGADSLRGALRIEGGAERGQVQLAVDAAELLAGLDPAGGAPARCHGAVLPVRHSARVGRAMENYRLDAVCAAQRSSDRSSSQRSAVLGRLGGRPTPTEGRCQGDRHLNFRESRDNLPTTPDTSAAPIRRPAGGTPM